MLLDIHMLHNHMYVYVSYIIYKMLLDIFIYDIIYFMYNIYLIYCVNIIYI